VLKKKKKKKKKMAGFHRNFTRIFLGGGVGDEYVDADDLLGEAAGEPPTPMQQARLVDVMREIDLLLDMDEFESLEAEEKAGGVPPASEQEARVLEVLRDLETTGSGAKVLFFAPPSFNRASVLSRKHLCLPPATFCVALMKCEACMTMADRWPAGRKSCAKSMWDHYLGPILAEVQQATRQKLWRDAFAYLLALLMIGQDTWVNHRKLYYEWDAFRSWSAPRLLASHGARLPRASLRRYTRVNPRLTPCLSPQVHKALLRVEDCPAAERRGHRAAQPSRQADQVLPRRSGTSADPVVRPSQPMAGLGAAYLSQLVIRWVAHGPRASPRMASYSVSGEAKADALSHRQWFHIEHRLRASRTACIGAKQVARLWRTRRVHAMGRPPHAYWYR